MKTSPTYIYRNRHGTFYFRIVIPAKLRPLIQGKREIRRSLKTDSERLALKRARLHAVHFESIFDRVLALTQQNDDFLSESDLEYLETLVEPELSAVNASPPEPTYTNEQLAERQRLQCIAQLLTGRIDRPIPTHLDTLANELLEHSRSYYPTQLPRELPRLREELLRARIGQAGAVTIAQPSKKPNSGPEMDTWTLYQVWEHRLAGLRSDPSREGGEAYHAGSWERAERAARAATVLTQHKAVCEITKEEWQAAYDAARRMKRGANASIAPDEPTRIEDFLTADSGQMVGQEVTVATIRLMMGIHEHAYKRLGLTAVQEGDLMIPPVQRRSTEERRQGAPFSPEDLEKIFSGYIYRGPVPADRTKAYPFWFWLPLVGYFTGARTNEIAQLDTSDIREIEGYPCFDFSPEDSKAFEAKRVKNKEARQVPIHPRLIELGLLDYVASQRKSSQKKLFGDGLRYLRPRSVETDHNKEGWAKSASKFFNEAPKGYLVTLGVHLPKDGKSIYSFRHTLETNLRNARRDGRQVDQTIIDAITGHAPETIAGRHYDGGPTIIHKLAALDLLPIPNAMQQLTNYQVDFVDRFGKILEKSIASHRRRHPRTV